MEVSEKQQLAWQRGMSSFCHGDLPQHALDRPNLEHFFQLTAALLLCIVFSVLSALDAKDQCLKHETYAVLQLVDDDNIQTAYTTAVQHESDKCLQMFHHVVLPSGIASCIAAFFVLAIISYHNRSKPKSSTSIHSSQNSLQVTTIIAFLFLIILILQTYAIIEIMLEPRFDDADDAPEEDSSTDYAANPYQSLAAVDRWGQVGDNANLYYLAWFSQGLIVTLVYQSLAAVIRGWRSGSTRTTLRSPDWYHTLYRLRTRTGIWTAAGCSCVVLVASAQYILGGPPQWSTAWAERPRTMGAWVSGYGTAVLCAMAVTVHFLSHRHVDLNISSSSLLSVSKRMHNLPLKIEMVLAFLLSIMLGLNAVFVTGVQGPASSVGNLYYASWFSFLLCIRICLGCVEEIYNVEEELEDEMPTESSRRSYEAPINLEDGKVLPNAAYGVASPSQSADSSNSTTEKQEKRRVGRVRGYFFLSIFSAVCAASAYDAASNQNMDLSWEQMYMVLAPFVVSMVMLLMFLLSLSKRAYAILSRHHVGGVLSVVTFGTWLLNLVLTMHSEDSWAVNGIGEIKMANLYYFCWASILTAGIQMTSYGKALFQVKKLDHMAVVWVAIWKVCFVILGAGLHVWHTISDNCKFDEITLGAVTFCSRTILAITVALTGLVVGSVVVLSRFLLSLCPSCGCQRIQAHVEMLTSLFLVFLFIAAVALITGIGGPGQSVGDLYYSTWLAFWVSLSTFVSCFRQLNEEDDSQKSSGTSSGESGVTNDGVLT